MSTREVNMVPRLRFHFKSSMTCDNDHSKAEFVNIFTYFFQVR